MTKVHDEEELRKFPPLSVIDAIDKWVHAQTRFHLSDTDSYKQMLIDVSNAITSRDQAIREETDRELLEFAIEVVYQWAHEPTEGTYVTGGLSTLESAFAVLRRHNLLNKKGHYIPSLHSTNPKSVKEQ